MTGPAFLADEEGRLRALASYNVVGTPPEKDYDHIARLAADLFDTPIALVSLVHRETQWFVSAWKRRRPIEMFPSARTRSSVTTFSSFPMRLTTVVSPTTRS